MRDPGQAAAIADQKAAAKMPSHIPALDGFRGLAILLVLFCHLTVMQVHTGVDRVIVGLANRAWVGVDLFFVLSGFLITGILFDAKGTNRYFRNFYARRTVRIFPLYYAVVFMTLVVFPRLPFEAARDFGRLDGRQVWYWLYLSNFHQAYMGHFTNHVLGLSWSLAIEEQFYLLWPAMVFLFSRKTLMRICGGLIAAALLTRLGITFAGRANDMNLYVLTPCRMDGLALGAFIALAARGPNGIATLVPWGKWLLPISAAIVLPLLKYDLVVAGHDISDSLLYSFVDLACGALLILVLGGWRMGLRLFENPVIRSFGRYSYALYLFHYPITLFLRDHGLAPGRFPTAGGSQLPGQLLFYVIVTAVAFIAALGSWNLFEKHFLRLKRFFPARSPDLTAAPVDRAGHGLPDSASAGGDDARCDSSLSPASASTAAAQ